MSSLKTKYKLGILVSGSGSNLQAIIDATNDNCIPDTSVAIVISNKKDAFALQRARNSSIDSLYLNPSDYDSKEDYDRKICKIMFSYNVDLVILAGYLRIVTLPLLKAFENRILNIHPSMLPAFGGINMYGMKVHKAVIAQGEKFSGCTVHIVTEDVDKGPIVDQISVKVENNDTAETLAKRVLSYEHQLYPLAIKNYLKNITKEDLYETQLHIS